MSDSTNTIEVDVDVTNPGQFFACCGLLEIADRLWPGAEGWFADHVFKIHTSGTLLQLIDVLTSVTFTQTDLESNTSSPLQIELQSHPLRLDWWLDTRAGGRDLKVWAGTMESVRIARAMQFTMCDERFRQRDLLNIGTLAYDAEDPTKKVEPYYFDARRGPNAHSRDVGFSTNDLSLTTTAFPAVELLCLVGLQRCLPRPTGESRVFEYAVWRHPLSPPLAAVVVAGCVALPECRRFRFENWYRTGQRKHKAFRSAVPIDQGD